MRRIELTVAKLRPDLWEDIKAGRKQVEVRVSEAFPTPVVLFTAPDDGRFLGAVIVKEIARNRPGLDQRSFWTWEFVEHLTGVPVDELKKMYPFAAREHRIKCEDLYMYKVTPINSQDVLAGIVNADMYTQTDDLNDIADRFLSLFTQPDHKEEA